MADCIFKGVRTDTYSGSGAKQYHFDWGRQIIRNTLKAGSAKKEKYVRGKITPGRVCGCGGGGGVN
jgi:hypothetical protein